jgi:transposase
MAKSRPPYPAEFRQQIVELAQTGKTPAQLSREFGVTAETIANGLAQANVAAAPPMRGVLSAPEREELVRLRRQVRQLQMERDILAKATAWFAGRGEKTFTPSTSS